MTSEVILEFEKFHDVSISRNLHKNWLIDECARNNLSKISLSLSHGVSRHGVLCDVEEITFLKKINNETCVILKCKSLKEV